MYSEEEYQKMADREKLKSYEKVRAVFQKTFGEQPQQQSLRDALHKSSIRNQNGQIN